MRMGTSCIAHCQMITTTNEFTSFGLIKVESSPLCDVVDSRSTLWNVVDRLSALCDVVDRLSALCDVVDSLSTLCDVVEL